MHKQNIFSRHNESETEQKITIPSEWYINSISRTLDNYKKKEFDNILNKLNDNIENSIEDYRFENIGLLSQSINYIIKYKQEYYEFQTILEEIYLNNQIIEFIYNETIEVEIKFKYNKKEKFFEINKKNINNKDKDNTIVSEDIQFCNNISEFTQKFPDIIYIQNLYNISLYDLEKEIKINECLNSYFVILNEHSSKKFKKELNDKIKLKIKNFIFEKIYNKIFPNIVEIEDLNLNKKISSLSCVKPENFNLNNFDFNSIIPILSEYFKQINIQRSPYSKLNIINKIFEIIFNVLKYIKGEKFSNDDILNISVYVIIKAKPEKLSSNIKYLEIFGNQDYFDNCRIYLKILKDSIAKIMNLKYKMVKDGNNEI
jgi:hypothetical protein